MKSSSSTSSPKESSKATVPPDHKDTPPPKYGLGLAPLNPSNLPLPEKALYRELVNKFSWALGSTLGVASYSQNGKVRGYATRLACWAYGDLEELTKKD